MADAVPPKGRIKERDDRTAYCVEHTHRHPAQLALEEETRNVNCSIMLGAADVLALVGALVKARKGKKCLDVGMFTGASALAAALALDKSCKESKVVTMDVSDSHIELAKKHWKMAGVEHLIQFELGPAGETLQGLIDGGQEATFDVAFVDADKTGYQDYYEKCLVLLKSGGTIVFDNTLWSGKVLKEGEASEDTTAMKKLNDFLAKDTQRAFVAQLNIADGCTIAVKA